MSVAQRIIQLNQQHPDWNDDQLAAAADCHSGYVRRVCAKHHLVRALKPRPSGLKYNILHRAISITVRLDDGMSDWLDREARNMGANVTKQAVVLAILRDAIAETTCE